MPHVSPKAVLFDLDGTLLNTLDDLADSCNAVLAEMGLPVHATDAYRYFVGDGVEMLARRVLPEGRRMEADVRAFVPRMREVYAQRETLKTRPYDGVPELLDELARRGLPFAVLSNKPDESTRSIVGKLLNPWRFAFVRGALPGVPKKPDPAAALEIARTLGIAPDSFLYLGDTGTDMRTATAAGMYPVGALWGFRDKRELVEGGAAVVIEHPTGLLAVVDDAVA
jgi:phosphoglycolate phosphatase